MSKFYPVKTEDGSISLFNTEINDIYHSKVGASTEALLKFVIPSGILDYVKNNNHVNILDVCFGLGYNSKVAINEIWKINPRCRINITVIDNDPDVLAFSTLIMIKDIDNRINEAFYNSIANLINIEQVVHNLTNYVNFLEAFNGDLDIPPYKISSREQRQTSLHNIYYRSISASNKNSQNIHKNCDFLKTTVIIEDARNAIRSLDTGYDFIFHDPFSPVKLPILWSVELFKEYYRLLADNGNITTYSSSAAIRSGLSEAGFYIGKTDPVGRKSSGTIAYKRKELITNHLSETENGLLNTKAGIPYYDPDFNFTIQELTDYRDKIKLNSQLISSTSYLKNHNNKNDL